MRQILHAGELKAFTLADGGEVIELNSNIWLTSCAREMAGLTDRIIFFKKDMVDRFLKTKLKTFCSNAIVHRPVGNERKGRPVVFPWKELHNKISRIKKEEGLPEKMEALISMLQHWCTENWEKAPRRTSIVCQLKGYYGKRKSAGREPKNCRVLAESL
jgi:hypothetical protein